MSKRATEECEDASNWSIHRDDIGRIYYFNRDTGASTLTKPTCFMSQEELCFSQLSNTQSERSEQEAS